MSRKWLPVCGSYLARLRAALASSGPAGQLRLARRAGGYAAEFSPQLVDVYRFRELARRARSGTAAGLFDAQLRLGKHAEILPSAAGTRGRPAAG